MEVDGTQLKRRKSLGDYFVLGFLLLFCATFGMLLWWSICISVLHPLFHAPVLSGAVTWEYGYTASLINVPVDDLALLLCCFLPLPLVTLIVTGWLRMPWWGWFSAAVIFGSCLSTLTYLSNPNYMGIEYAVFVQGGWMWACGLGFFFRWVVRALKIG